MWVEDLVTYKGIRRGERAPSSIWTRDTELGINTRVVVTETTLDELPDRCYTKDQRRPSQSDIPFLAMYLRKE